MKKFLLSILLVTFLIKIGLSQDIDKVRLDSYFKALETNNKSMGSVAISKNGQIIYTNQVGYADVENKKRPDANTKYRIGSISKTFTSVLIFKAIEAKKISLVDKLSQYFPEIENATDITIENLLHHRSGIHSFTSDEAYGTLMIQSVSRKELLSVVIKAGSDFKPDSKAEYSNSNFVILSMILEKIYKKDYSELLNELIIKTIKLQHTSYGKQININENEAYSYYYEKSWIKSLETDMSVPLGAGGIVSTPSDLVSFSNALFGGKLVSTHSLQLMMTIQDGFGMGLFKVPFNDKVGYGHDGRIDEFSSVFYHFDEQNVSVALISNGENIDNNPIAIVLISAAYHLPYEIPTFKEIKLTTEDLDKYLGVYSSKEFPLKVTITKNDNILMAQATGQSAFELEVTNINEFSFERAGIKLTFDPAEQTMILTQGKQYKFIKD